MNSQVWQDAVNRLRRRKGIPLPPEPRAFFERGLGRSLDDVRLHVDRAATEIVGARAFAVGRHIVLREAPRNWSTPASRYLVGHELAHCLQQRAVADDAPIVGLGADDHAMEHEAHVVALALTAGRRAAPLLAHNSAVVRRALTVKPKSAVIAFRRKPLDPTLEQGFRAPDTNTGEKDKVKLMLFKCKPIEPEGSAVILSDGTSMRGARLGFVQLLKETNFAIYHGRTNNEGSVVVRKRGNERVNFETCRDVLNDRMLVDAKSKDAPTPYMEVESDAVVSALQLVARYEDAPEERYDTAIINTSVSSKPLNFIDEVRIQLSFCVVLTFIPPGGPPEYLKHFKWHMHWNWGFGPPDAKGDIPGEDHGSGAGVDGTVVDGPPTDEFGKMLANTSLVKCETLTRNAEWKILDRKPGTVQQSPKRSKFNML